MSRGVDVNISGSVGDRPLHLASNWGYYRVTQMLLKKGARGMAYHLLFSVRELIYTLVKFVVYFKSF